MTDLFALDTHAAALGVEVVEWEPGRAVVRMVPGAGHANMLGGVHGGAMFSLGDTAFGIAANSWGRVCVALTMEIHYLVAPGGGVPLVATAVERARTRRTTSASIDITAEPTGQLVATMQAMGYRTHRWHLGEEAWPDDWRAAH